MIKASVVGATGFTGMVLTRLLNAHPMVEVGALTSTSFAGRDAREIFPHLRMPVEYAPYEPALLGDSEFVFVCYPHATSHLVVAELVDAGHRVIDLSADFRLSDQAAYPVWYGFEHTRPDLLAEAVYGLPEVYRERIAAARLVANPGCFPTVSLLAALPLLRTGGLSRMIVDAKSGVSGAGKTPTEKTHFSTVHDDFRAYGEVGHRHTSEMVQEVAAAAGSGVRVSFTPHLLPVDRGILATVYCAPVESDGGACGSSTALLSQEALQDLYAGAYRDEPFVEVVAAVPALSEVQHTNFCRMAVRVDEAAGLYKVVAVIDNLVKGASGQAVQNLNIMAGLPESMGLEGMA